MILPFNMSADYCSDWTALEAIREIVQNAIDSGQAYECEAEAHMIKVYTPNVVLEPKMFAMGVSIKDGKGAIGKYGEGFKVGMMVLTRLSLDPIIYTGNYIVKGLFETHEFTGVSSFCLDITETDVHEPGVRFTCNGGNLDLAELKHKIRPFDDVAVNLPETVDIWQDRPGELYVNGLFITNYNGLTFGYNFAPAQVTLNRDRNMVEGVQWQLGKFYGGLGKKYAEIIFNLIEADASDVCNLYYHLYNAELKAELTRLFFNKYGDGATISKPGTMYIGGGHGVSCNSTASSIYVKCGIEETKKSRDPLAPSSVLEDWYTAHKKRLRRDTRESLDKVIDRSRGWTKADT